jgi:Tfp pilus assembly protein PilF
MVVLAVAVAIAVGATRSLAAWARRTNQHVGAVAYAEALAETTAGHPAAALPPLRRAVAADGDNVQYELALARALTDTHHDDEARHLLVRLHAGYPEDGEINYRLARLSAPLGDRTATARYYRDAIAGTATVGAPVDRFAVRSDLTTWLLDTGQIQAAAAQVASLGPEIPPTAAAYVEAGILARRAGDSRRAVAFFKRARELDPTNLPAALGAGESGMEADDPAAAVAGFEAALRLGADRTLTEPELAGARAALAAQPRGRRGGR